jgi:2-keto-3-deoxy-L-rhamnonate aldolase RhmA
VRGDLLLGTILTLPSPEVAEILSQSGFDWLFVDMEHTQLDVEHVQRILQAVGREYPCLVRVPSMDEGCGNHRPPCKHARRSKKNSQMEQISS